MTATRIERDPLGEKAVPADALYGIQTLRAAENFPISGLQPLPAFVDAVVWIKRAAALDAQENRAPRARARRCDRRAPPTRSSAGKHRDQFIVDVYQAGAGTSHNMNCNEVLANRANEMLGGERGTLRAGASQRSRQHGAEHQRRDPDRHAAGHARHAARAARRRSIAWPMPSSPRGKPSTTIIKSGRTHLQDATPIRLGQEFTAYGHTVAAPPAEAGRRRPTGCGSWTSAAPRWAPASTPSPSIRR